MFPPPETLLLLLSTEVDGLIFDSNQPSSEVCEAAPLLGTRFNPLMGPMGR